MHKPQLKEEDEQLLVALRTEAERITQNVPEEDKPWALDALYAWRNDKTVTYTERS